MSKELTPEMREQIEAAALESYPDNEFDRKAFYWGAYFLHSKSITEIQELRGVSEVQKELYTVSLTERAKLELKIAAMSEYIKWLEGHMEDMFYAPKSEKLKFKELRDKAGL